MRPADVVEHRQPGRAAAHISWCGSEKNDFCYASDRAPRDVVDAERIELESKAATGLPRGRPPRLARDIAVLLAVHWFERAEGLPTGRAVEAVRKLWHAHGRLGLGDPAKASRAAFGCMRRARAALGDGRFVVLPGIDAGPMLTGAAAFYVPAGSTLRHVSQGRRQAIYGPFWRWSFDSAEAEFLAGSSDDSMRNSPVGNFVYRVSGSPASAQSSRPRQHQELPP